MTRRLASIVVVVVVLFAHVAWTQAALEARDDARIGAVATGDIGVFHPARYVWRDRVEVQLHPLVFLVAPHASFKVAHMQRGQWHLSGDYGLALPWLAEKLLQGYLFPTYKRDTGRLGFVVVPSIGALLSRATPARVLTAKLDAAVGVPLSHSDLRPLEAPAPLEMLFAPVLNKYRLRAGVLWDESLSRNWRARAYADVFVHGVDPDRNSALADHLTYLAGGGVDVALSSTWRAALGVVIWNNNQFAVDALGRRHRSTDVFPVIDLLWRRGP